MSESNDNHSGLSMEQFNINELAGATGLILGAVSGILVVIFKSRCYCKFRVGISDKWNICMCERKPPPDPKEEDSEGEEIKDKDDDKDKDKDKKLIPTKSKELEPEPEIEKLV